MERTLRWAAEAYAHYRTLEQNTTALFPIVQGSMFVDLRNLLHKIDRGAQQRRRREKQKSTVHTPILSGRTLRPTPPPQQVPKSPRQNTFPHLNHDVQIPPYVVYRT